MDPREACRSTRESTQETQQHQETRRQREHLRQYSAEIREAAAAEIRKIKRSQRRLSGEDSDSGSSSPPKRQSRYVDGTDEREEIVEGDPDKTRRLVRRSQPVPNLDLHIPEAALARDPQRANRRSNELSNSNSEQEAPLPDNQQASPVGFFGSYVRDLEKDTPQRRSQLPIRSSNELNDQGVVSEQQLQSKTLSDSQKVVHDRPTAETSHSSSEHSQQSDIQSLDTRATSGEPSSSPETKSTTESGPESQAQQPSVTVVEVNPKPAPLPRSAASRNQQNIPQGSSAPPPRAYISQRTPLTAHQANIPQDNSSDIQSATYQLIPTYPANEPSLSEDISQVLDIPNLRVTNTRAEQSPQSNSQPRPNLNPRNSNNNGGPSGSSNQPT